MPTALSTIAIAKEQGATYQPLVLVEIVFPDASVLRLSTHPLNTAEGGYTYGGNSYLGRISQQDIGQFQSLSETGIDLIPSVTLGLADPDAYLYSNWEKTKGFKGATLTARVVFYDPEVGNFSSDSRIPFVGLCEKPSIDAKGLTLTAISKQQLMKSLLPVVPIQPRCPRINPITTAQRADADNLDSAYYECGEIRDLATAPPCDYTKTTCTRPLRFGGITYAPPEGMRVREYVSGNWVDVKGNGNDAKYGDYFPLFYGQAWIEPPIMNLIPDGNYVRGEFVLCEGAAEMIKVLVNDTNLSPANDANLTGYSAANRDFRYNWINAGRRDGAPNADTPYNGTGDPYGSMTAAMFVVSKAVANGDALPKLRVLAKRKGLRKYQALASIVVSSNVATATLVGANTDIASNDSGWAFTIEGTSGTAINANWTGLSNWTYGPPGTFTFTTSGVANGTYTGGYIRYTADTDNVAWVIADLLTWTNYRYADLDVASFCAAAQKRATMPVSLVIRQRQSAMEILRGLRQAFGLMLVMDHATGKITLVCRETLADQQPAAIDGSNYNTAVSSKTAAGVTTNGYVAYRFDSASILRRDLPTSLKELSRATSDSPNRIAFTFADSAHEYAQSSISVVDSDDTARLQGQEVNGSLSVQPLGISSYGDAIRAARVGQAEIHRGNEGADTRGTRYFEWETSCRALHLKAGQLVLLNDTRLGLTNQLVRLTKIQPAQNYETVKLTGHWHDDNWYTNSYATSGAPVIVSRHHDVLARPAFAWQPDQVAPLSGDTMFAVSDKTFALDQAYTTAADGSKVAQVTVTGKTPINAYSTAAPPTVPLQATTATTGGSIPGNRVLWLAIASKDASGLLGAPSPLIRADIATGTATNTVTVSGLTWAAGVTGYVLFGGFDPNALTAQAESSTTPTSVTLTALSERAWGLPDCEFDHLNVRVKRIAKAGVLVAQLSAASATTLTVAGSTWTTNQWAGRDVAVMGSAGAARVPFGQFRVASNTASVLTITGPSPLSYSLGAGDYIVIRCAPSSASSTTVTDSGLSLATDEVKGKLLRVISGKARGQVTRITSNSATSLYGQFGETLDTTSRFVIEEADWQYTAAGSTIENNKDRTAPISVTVEVGNVTADALLVEAVAIDGGGAESIGNPVREIVLTGAVGAGGSGNTVVSDPTGLVFDGAAILDNGYVRVDFHGVAPTDADWAGYKRILEIPAWEQTDCAEIVLPADLYDKGDNYCAQTAAFSDVFEFNAPPLEWLNALTPGTVVQYVLYLLPFSWGNSNELVRLTDASPKTPTNGTPCLIFTVDYAGLITGGGVESGLGDITIRSASGGYSDPPTIDWSEYGATGQVFADIAYEPYYTGSGASRATVHRAVHVWLETVVASEPVAADGGQFAYNSENSLVAWEGNKGTFRARWVPFAGDIWIQGCAKGDSTEFPWKRASGTSPLAPSTRWRKLTISSGDMAAHAGDVVAPPVPTGLTVTVVDHGQEYSVDWAWTPPSPPLNCVSYVRQYKFESWDGTAWVIDSDWGADLVAYPETASASTDGPFPKIAGTYRLTGRIASVSDLGVLSTWVNSTPQNITPYGAPPQPPTCTLEDPLTYEDRSGVPYYSGKASIASAGTGSTVGYSWQRRLLNVAVYVDAGSVDMDWEQFSAQPDPSILTTQTDFWPMADTGKFLQVRCVPMNADGTPGTPSESAIVAIDASPGITPVDPDSAAPAGLSMHPTNYTQPYAVYQTNADPNGIRQWYAFVKWTAETPTAERAKLAFAYSFADATWAPTTTARPIGSFSISQGALDLPPQPYAAAASNALMFVFIESKDGKLAQCAALHFVIPAGPTGQLNPLMLDLAKAAGFKIANGKLMLDADGTNLVVDSNGKVTATAAMVMNNLGVDPAIFSKVNGVLTQNAIATNLLVAALAIITGAVVVSNGAGSITIAADGSISLSTGGSTATLNGGNLTIPYVTAQTALSTGGDLTVTGAAYVSGTLGTSGHFNIGSELTSILSRLHALDGQ